jgi:hypothetical protein
MNMNKIKWDKFTNDDNVFTTIKWNEKKTDNRNQREMSMPINKGGIIDKRIKIWFWSSWLCYNLRRYEESQKNKWRILRNNYNGCNKVLILDGLKYW